MKKVSFPLQLNQASQCDDFQGTIAKKTSLIFNMVALFAFCLSGGVIRDSFGPEVPARTLRLHLI